MANEKFTQLPQVVSASVSDIICAVQGGVSVQETLQQVINLGLSNTILNNAGNPNGALAGNIYQLCWDTLDLQLYICTTTGSASTAVWTLIGDNLILPMQGGTGVSNPTAHTIPVAEGASNFNFLGPLTNGQILIGSTGNNPVATAITVGPGLTATSGAGSFQIAFTSTTGSGGVVLATAPIITTPSITGITDASSASAGVVGEVISSSVVIGSAVSLTTGTPTNVTSISLTPGDWDVYGQIGFSVNAATTISDVAASISLTSNTLALSSDINGSIQNINTTFTTGNSLNLNAGNVRINVNSSTTVFLVASMNFAVNTASAYGSIWARRRR